MHNIFLIVGKSGTGKSTLANNLKTKSHMKVLDSYTTRAQREKDEAGHTFITNEQMDVIYATQNIVAETMFDGNRYCATQQQIDDSDIYVIDPSGVNYLAEKYKGDKNIVVIELVCDNDECLQNRMLKRGDNLHMIQNRLENDIEKFDNTPIVPWVDHYKIRVENNDEDDVFDLAMRIITYHQRKYYIDKFGGHIL